MIVLSPTNIMGFGKVIIVGGTSFMYIMKSKVNFFWENTKNTVWSQKDHIMKEL
jgi:hypothetical protein